MVETSMSVREWQEKAKEQDAMKYPRPFIVCPKCGNKRCPHATDRKFECSGSNAPGQIGSVYE